MVETTSGDTTGARRRKRESGAGTNDRDHPVLKEAHQSSSVSDERAQHLLILHGNSRPKALLQLRETPHGSDANASVGFCTMNQDQTQLLRPNPEAAPVRQASPAYRVLVVEDDPYFRQLNTDALTQSGYEVDAAEDGAAAWNALRQNNYDLMITDQRMPRVSGLELLTKLRAARLSLPVIMATGTVPEAIFSRQPWLKPEAVLLKPYTIPELLSLVTTVLQADDYSREHINALLSWRGQTTPVELRA
jgi:CheY-like chemotaxis protein